jgi:hypothetical protein
VDALCIRLDGPYFLEVACDGLFNLKLVGMAEHGLDLHIPARHALFHHFCVLPGAAPFRSQPKCDASLGMPMYRAPTRTPTATIEPRRNITKSVSRGAAITEGSESSYCVSRAGRGRSGGLATARPTSTGATDRAGWRSAMCED